MLRDDEVEELRTLQARAYRRGGAPTAREADRLRELETRRLLPASGPAPQPSGTESAAETPDAFPPVAEAMDDEASDAADTDSPTAAPSVGELLRSRWRPAALAAVLVLVVGVGLGWFAFGRSGGDPVPLTAEQQGWQHALIAEGVYDSGSVRALAVEGEAVVWTATKDERARTCLILSNGEMTVPTCDLTPSVRQSGIYGSIRIPLEGDSQREINAQMLLTAAGEPAVAVSTYQYSPGSNGMTYANDAETKTAKRLSEAGFDVNSIWVAGYDDDVPIWTASELDTGRQCLIHDGSTADAPMACVDPGASDEQGTGLVLTLLDAEGDGSTRFEMSSSFGPSFLVITHEGSVTGAGGD